MSGKADTKNSSRIFSKSGYEMFMVRTKDMIKHHFPRLAEQLIMIDQREFFKKRKLEVHLADHCNLNCRCCDHYSPIAEKSFVNLEELKQMYEKLQPYYDRFFKKILLLGGEPLLNPQIEQALQLTASYFPNTTIEIVTNGLRLPSMEEGFWELCRKYNVLISVTEYPGIMSHDKLESLFKEKKVNYRFWVLRETFMHGCLDPDGKQNKRKSWHRCNVGGNCLQLRDGRIYPCAQSAYINIINKTFGTNFQHQKGDYISLEDLGSRWQFWKFVLTARPFCRYCNREAMKIEKWGISQKKREEWLPK